MDHFMILRVQDRDSFHFHGIARSWKTQKLPLVCASEFMPDPDTVFQGTHINNFILPIRERRTSLFDFLPELPGSLLCEPRFHRLVIRVNNLFQ